MITQYPGVGVVLVESYEPVRLVVEVILGRMQIPLICSVPSLYHLKEKVGVDPQCSTVVLIVAEDLPVDAEEGSPANVVRWLKERWPDAKIKVVLLGSVDGRGEYPPKPRASELLEGGGVVDVTINKPLLPSIQGLVQAITKLAKG